MIDFELYSTSYISDRHKMKFVRTYKVRSSEITPDYLMKEYFVGMYFQECFAEYATSKEVAAFHLAKRGLTWLTSDARVEFFPPMPFWRKEVEVSTWIYKITPVRIFVNFEAKSEGRCIAVGTCVQLVADLKTHRPQRSDLVALDVCPEPVFKDNDAPFPKIEMFDNGCCADLGVNQISQVVRFDDLDFNMHLNNVRYIPRALEAVDLEYRTTHRLESYRVKYEREARFGDTIESFMTRRGNELRHILRNSKDGAELCRMISVWIEK